MDDCYIYLFLSRTGTVLSNIIHKITGDEYVHISLSLDDTFKKMYAFGRSSFTKGGLVTEDIHTGIFNHFKEARCLVHKIPVTKKQFLNLQQELNTFMAEQNKYKFSFLGLIGLHFNIYYKREHYYFCSQFIGELLNRSGIYNTSKLPEFMKPSDFLEIENKEFFYEGLICEYNDYEIDPLMETAY